MTPDQYCQDKAVKSGSSFYSSFRFLPEEKRRAITALYAFCREVDDVVDGTHDDAVARSTLNWWRAEIDHLYAGSPQHPVTKALLPAIKAYDLQREHFLEIIDGMEMDLDIPRYASFKDLQLYCYPVASVVGFLITQILGYTDRRTQKYAHDLGLAFQLTNIIRDVGEDVRRGRIYIPLDELQRFNVTADDLFKLRETPEFNALMEFQIERAEEYYVKALAELPAADRKAQRCGLVMAAVYRTTLQEIKRHGAGKVLNQRLSLGKLRKVWLAWKTWFFS